MVRSSSLRLLAAIAAPAPEPASEPVVAVGALAGRKILVDCGMFQGQRNLHIDNDAPFGFDPAEIDLVLLTHAHLDHCGRIPLLVDRGFDGEIVCTAATRDLARLVMLDAAHLTCSPISVPA